METATTISSILLWVISLLNFTLLLVVVRKVNDLTTMNSSIPDLLEIGAQAPEFEVETLDERKVSKRDFADQNLVLVFIAPGCGPCRDQIPLLNKLHSEVKKHGYELLIVSLSNKEEAQTYVEEVNFTAPIFVTPYKGNFATEYKIPGTPSYYLIDKKGVIQGGGFFDEKWKSLVNEWQSH